MSDWRKLEADRLRGGLAIALGLDVALVAAIGAAGILYPTVYMDLLIKAAKAVGILISLVIFVMVGLWAFGGNNDTD